MTKRRRRLLIVLAVLALLGGTLALPPVHWWLCGKWRGDPFYRGRPASYYATQARGAVRLGTLSGVRTFSPPEAWVRDHLSDALANLVWGGPPPFHGWGGMPRSGQLGLDSETIPVILVMVEDADPGVRLYATVALQNATLDDPDRAIPCLTQLLDDDNPWVRYAAASGLGRCSPAARVALPKLRTLVGDSAACKPGMVVGAAAAEALEQLDDSAR
jgi:hypothetical protein